MLKTFTKGGIHPAENKLSEGQKIQVPALPATVYIPLSQHIGAPAKPIVQRGDLVKTGQVIAINEGFVSTNVHSSVSGKVSKIDLVRGIVGYKRPAVIIDVTGDEWLERIDRSEELVPTFYLIPQEIIQIGRAHV